MVVCLGRLSRTKVKSAISCMTDLHCFDLDGTLVKSEGFHYEAYMRAGVCEISFDEYTRCDTDMTSDPVVYARKKAIFLQLIEGLEFMPGMQSVWENTPHPKCIVTHSDRETLTRIMDILPVLKDADLTITRDECQRHKPHPDAYIRAIRHFPQCRRVIGYEDSYKGYVALVRSGALAYKLWPANDPVGTMFEKYHEGLESLKHTIRSTLDGVMPIVTKCTGNVYLSGIGKCGYVCEKSVSTWQSLGIPCHFLNILDASHGGFGILRPGDVIMYISNSGRTSELVQCSSYVKKEFPDVTQVGFTIKPGGTLCVDYTFQVAHSVHEIDSINMAPTTSSMVFMALLDILGVTIAESQGLTVAKFQRNHPGGELGKKSVAK